MSTKTKLRDLRLRAPKPADVAEINLQIKTEHNDRGAAMLAATLLENTLRWAIFRRFVEVAYRFSRQSTAYFDNNGMLSTFDAKLKFGDTLNTLGPVTLSNLDLIKHIRNTFAHSGIPITFSTPEIASACDELTPPEGPKGQEWNSPRDKFITTCLSTATQLVDYADSIHRIKAGNSSPLESAFSVPQLIPVMPPSLP